MNRTTIYGEEARDKMLSGVQKISRAVKSTLGPSGRCVMISLQGLVPDHGWITMPTRVSKDGYTVARDFDLEDPLERAGVMIVKEAAAKSVDQSGDGTTTTVLLLEAIVEEGIDKIRAGANPMELKRGIDKAVTEIIDQWKKIATPVRGDNDKIRQIATISANNDPEIGGIIADAFKKIGDEGVIDLVAGSAVETEIKIADGYKWDNGWVSHYFRTNEIKQVCEFENPLILLYEKRINHHTQVTTALEFAVNSGRPILIVCEDAADEGLAFLAMNNIQKRVRCCVVKAPGLHERRREAMEDLAVLTGATYISDTKGVGIKEIEIENLGVAQKVIVTKDETIIIGAGGDKEELENLLNELRMNLAQAKTEEEKHPIEKRIAQISGGVAVIHVGAATETEMKEKLDRFDDAVRATKAAISEGCIVGGGTAFLRVKTDNVILKEVLTKPLFQICDNAGVDGNEIVSQIAALEGDMGYNAKTFVVEDLVKSGVIDPVKVLRCALTNAASSAGMILTAEALISDLFK